MKPKPQRLIPIGEVCAQAGIGRSEVYRRLKAGTFPKQIVLGTSVRWVETEVQAWVAQRIADAREQEEREATA